MTQIILLILIVFCFSWIWLFIDNHQIRKELKKQKIRQDNTDLVVVKLMFHKAQEIEDYETCRKIKEKMGNNFELYKF